MTSNPFVYNLKAVIHETGLTPATLRAWERRYDFLKPKRSPGGHRLYTQDEIDMLKWLVARQAEGLSISHAVEMWRSQQENFLPQSTSSSLPQRTPGAAGSTLDQLRNNWCTACLAFNEPEAELAMAKALAMAAPDVVCVELLQKGMADLGEGWYAGRVSIQQEHFASALAMRRLNALFAVAPPPARPERILAACPPSEDHDMALLMASFILRWRGWEVIYLGANVPLETLDATLRSTAPSLALSVAQTLPGAAALSELAGFVYAQSVQLAYGGGIFKNIPALTGHISGHFLGHELAAVPQVVEHLLSRPPMLPAPQTLSHAYTVALTEFKEKEALIVTSVRLALKNSAIAPRHLEQANVNFTRSIVSALVLGEIDLLEYSADWLNGLLKNYGLSPALAAQYYAAYHQAVQQHLGSQAGPILDWFTQVEIAANNSRKSY